MSDPKADAKSKQAVETAAALTAIYVAARADVMKRFAASGSLLGVLTPVWRDLLQTRVRERAAAVVAAVAPDVFPERVAGKVDAYAEWFARTWDDTLRERIAQLDVFEPDLQGALQDILDSEVDTSHLRADSLSVDMGNFAAIEEATIQGHKTKTWRIKGATTRPTHVALSGKTIPIADNFANGLQYPGAPGPPEERVNCDCYLTFGSE